MQKLKEMSIKSKYKLVYPIKKNAFFLGRLLNWAFDDSNWDFDITRKGYLSGGFIVIFEKEKYIILN